MSTREIPNRDQLVDYGHAVAWDTHPDGRSDYINASHIKASRSNKRYLATQGPLPATFEDFWTVIWDQDVRVIVMLTAESEGGQLKCHAYWKNREYGPVRLKMLSEKKVSLDIDKQPADSPASQPSPAAEMGRRRAHTTTAFDATSSVASPQPPRPAGETPYVVIRKFALSHAAHPFAPMREVTHLHYPSWPDFGAPAQPSHLLALVELANVMQKASLPVETTSVVSSRKASLMPATWTEEPESDRRVRPMLVHCSAGCGRTGAFCTVDSVIDMLKRQRVSKSKKNDIAQNDADHDVDMSDATPTPACQRRPLVVLEPLVRQRFLEFSPQPTLER
ncbi:hypothetical protein jhhlp_004281 [Lomentospora prolificans]|uniref:Tyrosine specific protein phosphatases domain-containing protein n=1 Tax=Lomentospora prolificans TaxID=41688 RepID=A0A2N3NB71_9PEZI|nr:hypothetical protein jhhlp_004281 [Lomentospora prolificans]